MGKNKNKRINKKISQVICEDFEMKRYKSSGIFLL